MTRNTDDGATYIIDDDPVDLFDGDGHHWVRPRILDEDPSMQPYMGDSYASPLSLLIR